MDYQTQAIILKTQRLNEADKILHLYSPDFGPIKAIAKGSYKIQSRFGAKSQVLNCCDFLLATGRNLHICKEMKLLDSFKNLRTDYDALNYGYYCVEILDHIAINDDHYREPFDLLIKTLIDIDADPAKTKRYVMKFLWEITKLLGYKPQLDYCNISQRERSRNQIPQYFDLENGSIITEAAYNGLLSDDPYQDHVRKIQAGVFKIWEELDSDLEISDDLPLPSALKLLNKHLEHQLRYEFRAWRSLESELVLQVAA